MTKDSFYQGETHIWQVLMEHMLGEYGRKDGKSAVSFGEGRIRIQEDIVFPECGFVMKAGSICRILMFDRENPEASLDFIMDYEDACLQEEAERMPETAGYYYLVNLDERTDAGKKWIEELRLRMNTLDARDIQREYWDIGVLEHILEKAPFLKMYTSFLPKEKYDKNGMPEFCEKGLETLERYLEKCFIEDQCSRMEQAGSVTDGKVKLQKVFVDLEAEPEDAPNAETGSLFVEQMVDQGNCVNRFQKSFIPESHVKKYDYLLLGAAGQGKSTVCQYLIQIYRAFFLEWRSAVEARKDILTFLREYRKRNETEIFCHRIPIHITIKAYAAWMQKRIETENTAGALFYIIEQIERKTGEVFSLETFRTLLKNFSWLFVFDGLDEVPSSSNRERVIMEIREFIYGELRRNDCDNLLICTSRPQGNLEGFHREEFCRLRLRDLSADRCLDYLDRLMEQMSSSQDEKEHFMSVLRESAKDPVVSRLMRSPLQATIVAILVKTGGKPPRDRYNLFDTYYQTMKNREKQKDMLEGLHDTLDWMDEIHYRLALKLQKESASDQNPSAVISESSLIELIRDYLEETDDEIDPDEMSKTFFHILTERLCFISDMYKEKEYMFVIRSMQEFLAANGIVRQREAVVIEELNRIASSTYWRNVFLFAAGYLNKNVKPLQAEIYRICENLNGADCTPAQLSLEKISQEGSWLALDILIEGIYKGTAKIEKNYYNLFFRLKDFGIAKGFQECRRLDREKKEYLKQEYILPALEAEPRNQTLWYLYCLLERTENIYRYLRSKEMDDPGVSVCLTVMNTYFAIWNKTADRQAAEYLVEFLEVPENQLELTYDDCCRLINYGNVACNTMAWKKILRGMLWDGENLSRESDARKRALEKLPDFWGYLEMLLNRFRKNKIHAQISRVMTADILNNDMEEEDRDLLLAVADWFAEMNMETEAAFLRLIFAPDRSHLRDYLYALWKEAPSDREKWIETHEKQHYLVRWMVRRYSVRKMVSWPPEQLLEDFNFDYAASYRTLRQILEQRDWKKIWDITDMLFDGTGHSQEHGIHFYMKDQRKEARDVPVMNDLELAHLLFICALTIQNYEIVGDEEAIMRIAYEEYRNREQTDKIRWVNIWARRIALYLLERESAAGLLNSGDDYRAFLPLEDHPYIYQEKTLATNECKLLTEHVVWMLQVIDSEQPIFRMIPALILCCPKTEWSVPAGKYRQLLHFHCEEALKELGRLLFLMMVRDWSVSEARELGAQVVHYLESAGEEDAKLFLRLGKTFDVKKSVNDPVYVEIYKYLRRREAYGSENAGEIRTELCEFIKEKIESSEAAVPQ